LIGGLFLKWDSNDLDQTIDSVSFHLAFMLFILVFIFLFSLISRSEFRDWVSRTSERKTYSVPGQLQQEHTRGSLLLPRLMILWTGAVIAGVFVMPSMTLESLSVPAYKLFQSAPAASVLANIINVTLVVCFFIAMRVHFRPNHSRRLKYTVIMFPIPLLALTTVPKATLGSMGYPDLVDAPFAVSAVLIMLIVNSWGVVTVLTLAVAGGRWLRSKTPGRISADFSSSERRFFRFVQMSCAGPLLIVLFFLSRDLMLIVLMFRYIVIERFRQKPIIYLRSFQHADAVRVFGRAVAPAISSYGVIVGLVSGVQTKSVLMSRTSVWQFGVMATVPDERWREWVERALQDAAFAVVDCTILTDSVLWETRTAVSLVEPDHVVLITSEGGNPHVDIPDLNVFTYTSTQKSLIKLKRDLKTWTNLVSDHPIGRIPHLEICAWVIIVTLALFLRGIYLVQILAL
jgi:hypothetical protein